jgi:hypothetical protein
MTASNFMMARDILVAEMIRKRAELGYFDTQFIQYGASYWKAGQVHYIIADDDVMLFYQMHALGEEEKYATQIISFNDTLHVPEGAKEVYEAKLRAQNIKKLRLRLPDAYFDIVRTIPLESEDAAVPILEPIREALVGRSHEAYLNIMQGLVELARERYQLKFSTYQDYLAWIERERALIINRITRTGRFNTTVFGFAVDSGGPVPKIFATATESDMLRKRELYTAQDKRMSPVLTQNYTYDDHTLLRMLRPKFMDMAKKYMDASYMETVNAIYDLPSPIPAQAVAEADAAIAAAGLGPDVETAWQLQKKRWGV